MARIKNEEISTNVKLGRPKISKNPSKVELQRLYIKDGKSIRQIAAILGLHPDTIHYWLKKYEIRIRSRAKRSKLRKYNHSIIDKGIKEHGIRGYARKLGVHENTLRHYLKRINVLEKKF